MREGDTLCCGCGASVLRADVFFSKLGTPICRACFVRAEAHERIERVRDDARDNASLLLGWRLDPISVLLGRWWRGRADARAKREYAELERIARNKPKS